MNLPKTIISVAPNGARKTKSDHINLPISPEELAQEAHECYKAGAAMIHLHVRDENGQHTLLPKHYRPAINAIRQRLGNKVIIQTTTEATGIFSIDDQISSVIELKPEATSLAINELCPEGMEEKARQFFHHIHSENIAPQYILYSADEVKRFISLHQMGIIPDAVPSVLLVLGRYGTGVTSTPQDLIPMLDALKGFKCTWTLCAFGLQEHACMLLAIGKGGHCRIGFENNIYRPNKEVASHNSILVKDLVAQIKLNTTQIATTEETRRIYNIKK